MYPENPEGTQVIVGSVNMGLIPSPSPPQAGAGAAGHWAVSDI